MLATIDGGGTSRSANVPPKWSISDPAVPASVVQSTRLFRERLLSEAYRPGYHFCPPDYTAGDSNGWYLEEFERLDEPRPINLGGGKAMILARSCEGHLWEIRSDDDGQTWSEPKPTALVHPDAPPMLFHHPDGKTLVAFHHNSTSGSHFMHSDRSEIWVSLSADQGRTWSESRFVFANALAPGRQSAWYNHQCSYMDMFADGEDLHLFVPHRWKRALHLHLKASDLKKLPTKAQLSIRQ